MNVVPVGMGTPDGPLLARNIRAIRDAIEAAASRVGRDPRGIRLLAATKTVPVERLRLTIQAGLTLFGENRLQEALPKVEALKHEPIEWHFIGRLQRRKVKQVVGLFAMIHSVDSVDLAEEIQQRAESAGLRQPVLLEVNIGGEASKGGFAPQDLERVFPELARLPNVLVQGLMTIPAPTTDPEGARPAFRHLRELAAACGRLRLPTVELSELSMGMSHDFVVAVEEGATIVRVGTGIFGARPA